MRGAQPLRETQDPRPARQMLGVAAVASKQPIEPWTIPLHVIMWTTLLCGLIMVMVVVLMH